MISAFLTQSYAGLSTPTLTQFYQHLQRGSNFTLTASKINNLIVTLAFAQRLIKPNDTISEVLSELTFFSGCAFYLFHSLISWSSKNILETLKMREIHTLPTSFLETFQFNPWISFEQDYINLTTDTLIETYFSHQKSCNFFLTLSKITHVSLGGFFITENLHLPRFDDEPWWAVQRPPRTKVQYFAALLCFVALTTQFFSLHTHTYLNAHASSLLQVLKERGVKQIPI
ncbi:MAG: hypothetical protein KDK76_01895 [Chlamydiia bacterium]|nr:hypothetical protein [Chlamydiia bacterium]